MRITLVNFSLGLGGSEWVLSTLANYWAAQGRAVTIVTVHPAPSFFSLHEGVSHVHLGLNPTTRTPSSRAFNLARRLLRFRSTIRNTRPDIVIAFQTATNIMTLLATRNLGVPVVVSERSNPAMYTWCGAVGEWARRKTYPLAACVVMQSQCARDWLAARTPGRFVVIPNPVPHPPPSSAIPELRRSPSITAMGRLSHEKGFDLLIRAFAKVRGPHPDWTLTIFGEGAERKALEALRDSLGLGACVQLPGVVDKPHDVLRQSDLFVFPSRFEGFPNALCEAMACGLPVIAADCRSGPREIIKHGINGLLVAPGDHVQLAETIKQLIEDPPLRSRLGANAATLPEQFSLSSIMQQWDRVIYDSCSRGLCPDQPNPSRAQAA